MYNCVSLFARLVLFWMITSLRITDGFSITWTEPPPPYTATDVNAAPRVTPRRILRGSTNVSLTWAFNLSSGDTIDQVDWSLGVQDVAVKKTSGTLRVFPDFEGRVIVNSSAEATLITLNVTEADEGQFQCVVETDNAFWWKDIIEVEVIVGASIVAFSGNQNIPEGDSVTLSCNASGSPDPVVTWTNVNTGENIVSNTLVIQNINRSQAGEYRCDATNDCGDDSRTAIVTVLYKPENVTLMTNASMSKTCRGTMVHFSCMVGEASPPLSFKLFKDNVMVNEVPASPGVWILMMANEGDAQYRCEASNTVGTAMSASSLVIVNSAPSVELVHDPMPWIVGEIKILTCQVSGRPMPDVFWKKKGGARRNATVWMFTDLTTNDAGEYVCEASNECGSVSKSINITVRVGRCKKNCENRKECRQFGGKYLCLCPVGKTGENCNDDSMCQVKE